MNKEYARAICAWVAAGDVVRPGGMKSVILQPQLVQAFVMEYNQRHGQELSWANPEISYAGLHTIVLSPHRVHRLMDQPYELVRRVIHQQQDHV